MIITNLRVGFATNSSSSHSVVLLPDHMAGKVDDKFASGFEFGQSNFVLASTEAKMRYIAAQLVARLGEDGQKVLARLEKEAAGITEAYGREDDYCYVDHQSQMMVPNHNREEFVDGVVRYFNSPNVVILGGGDNYDDFQPFGPDAVEDQIGYRLLRSSGSETKVRVEGDNFILFDMWSGNKFRANFDRTNATYTKSAVPELVDLKITDYCNKGCKFCYQSSTVHGVHADFKTLKKAIDLLAELDVFEIAIGGGEPTTHPRFKDILQYANDKRVRPNFTTLSRDWLDDRETVKVVKETVGAIGVSCLSAKDIAMAEEIMQKGASYNTTVMVQHVIGSVPLSVTAEFLSAAFEKGFPVLLLGYKQVGFGKDYQRHDQGSVAAFLRIAVPQDGQASLSVDTALVDQHPDIPAALGAPEALVTSPEGKFSCYIDAVTMKMAASSYVEPSTMDDLTFDPKAFTEQYARY